MENEGQLNNNNGQDLSLTIGNDTTHNNNAQDLSLAVGNDTTHLVWNDPEEYDMDTLLGAEDHANTDQAGDGEDQGPESGTKRVKRFTMEQIQQLEAMFQVCPQPDPAKRQELATKIGLEARQVKFWFQNRRSQVKAKACGNENSLIRQENAKLLAENLELQKMVAGACFRCRNPTAPAEPTPEKLRLLNENALLKDQLLRATADMNKLLRGAAPLPPSVPSSERRPPAPAASMGAVPAALTYDGSTNRAALLSHAERAMKEFEMLAMEGEPMWLPTINGEVLNGQEYSRLTFPGLLGLCPPGFAVEATRETAMVRGAAADLVGILTNMARWSEVFPGIVAGVRSSNVVSGGICGSRDRLIQQMNVELWVQSPRLPIRCVEFLRFSKQTANRQWAVVDVSIDGSGGAGQEGGRAGYTGCRLLPSGCLLEDMSGGYCKVTWIVHAEYDGSTVPPLFRPLFHSGQAHGALRWLGSLQRQCEYMAILRSSSHVPSSDGSGSVISALGRNGVLELAQRMMASFYAAVSGPVTLEPSNVVDEWRGSSGTDAESLEAAVRMVTWNCAEIMPGEPAVLVLSATTTVWLPGTPPHRVFEYLCNVQRRGEWDALASNGAVVKELGSVATSAHLHGNAVSVLRPILTDGTNTNTLILQEASTDASCSLVVYSLIDENLMRAIMDGGDNTSVFLLPSGFAILPDAHGKAHNAAATSSSSAPAGHNTAGSLLTVACQALLPGPPSNALAMGAAFEDAGNRICHAIKKIKAAVGADTIVPA